MLSVNADYPTNETSLKAKITESLNAARQDSFQNLSPIFNANQYPKKDPNYVENLLAKVKGLTQVKDRYITFFEDNSYAVYGKNQTTCLYYRPNGQLFKIGQSVKPRGANYYPNRDVEYDANTGKMQSVGLYLSKSESFLFDTAGNLIVHWQAENGYNEQGQIILRRKWVKQES